MSGTVKITRWPYLAAGVASMMLIGIIYAWSILKAPLGEAFGWTAAQLAFNFTLTMCFFCFGGVVAGVLTKRSSPRVVLIIAAIFSCAGFVITSRLSGQLVLLYLSYGVSSGLGIGMAYNVLISSTNAWFPDKKGLCSGALMMGFGSSALVLGNIAGSMIGTPSIGWRSTYFIFGILMGAVLLIASFIMRFPPQGTELPESQKKAQSSERFELKDHRTTEMMKRTSFWMFFIMSISMAADATEAYSITIYDEAIAGDTAVVEGKTGHPFVRFGQADLDRLWAACYNASADAAINNAGKNGKEAGMVKVLEAAAKFTNYTQRYLKLGLGRGL
jgi:OFA family oxalate/formate antiporter-like MFS transporter